MRSLIVSSMVVGLVVASNAEAATSKKNLAKSKAAPAASMKVAAATPAPAASTVAAAPAASVAAPVAAPAMTEATSNVTTAQAVAPAAAKKLSASIRSYNEIGMVDANRTKGIADTALETRISYKLNDKVRVNLGEDITHTWGTTDGDNAKFKFTDPFVGISHSSIAEFIGGINLDGSLRYYAPVSEIAQEMKRLGTLRVDSTLSKEIAKGLTIGYTLSPRYFMQQYTTYFDSSKQKEMSTPSFRLVHFGEIAYDVSSVVSVYQDLGLYQKWTNGNLNAGVEEGRNSFLLAETGVNVNLGSTFEVSGGITTSESRDLLQQTNDFAVYREDETAYFLAGKMKF